MAQLPIEVLDEEKVLQLVGTVVICHRLATDY